MKYEIIRTDTADAGIRKIILYVAQNFGNTVALEKLDQIEKRILDLGDDPYIGTDRCRSGGMQLCAAVEGRTTSGSRA